MTFGAQMRWGAGITAVAAAGAAPRSDLQHWLDASTRRRRPAPGGAGIDAEDLGLLAGLGLGDVRLTLDWSRLEPDPGHVDTEAVDHARGLLVAAREAGLAPWACLHDGPLPGWFSIDEHGFADRHARQYFWSRHVEFAGETFGDLVHGWVPMFEPTRWAWKGWMDGTRPPGRHGDGERFAEQVEGALLADIDAARRLRQDGHPVVSSHQVTPVFAARDRVDVPPTPEAEAAASALDQILNRTWLGVLHDDELQVPGRGPVAVPGGSAAFDAIGLTYRHAVATRSDGSVLPYPDGGGASHRWWPEGLRLAVEQTVEQVPDAEGTVVTIGVTAEGPDEQAERLAEGLRHLQAAAEGGVDLGAVWLEAPIARGSGGPVVGLFDHGRRPRPSAAVVRAAIGDGTVPG